MKKAIVTGANGNLGRDFVEMLSKNNYEIIAIDKCTKNIPNSKKISPVKLDITDDVAVSLFYKKVGTIDLLVNNAGIGVFTPFEDRTAEEFKMVTDVNLLGTFLMSQGSIKLMKKQNYGKIVNIGSIYGLKSSDFRIYGLSGRNNSEVYSATKAGIIHLTKYMAAHFGQYNIQTNCISPGGVFNNQSEDFISNHKNKTPLGRMASTKDISQALEFLCSEKSNYLNGHNIVVDGGFVSW